MATVQAHTSVFGTDGNNTENLDVSGLGITAGEKLVVAAYSFSNTTACILDEIVDDQGNTYTIHGGATRSSTFRTVPNIASCTVVTAPSTITANYANGGAEISLACARVSALGAHESSAFGTETTDDPTFGSVTVAGAALVFGAICAPASLTFGNNPDGYTTLEEAEASGWTDFAFVYKAVAAGTYDIDWVTGGSANYGMGLSAFTDAGGGGPAFLPKILVAS